MANVVDFILADTNELQGDDVPGLIAALNNVSAADVNAQCDAALTDYDPPTRAELTTDTNSVLAKVLAYFRLLLRSDAAPTTDDATELTAINADGGSGAGNYDPTTDSPEAIRDHVGDGTNLSEAGGDGDHLTEAGGDGDHLTAINLPDQTMNVTGDVTGNLSGSVGSVTGAVGSVTGAVGSVTAEVTADVTKISGSATAADNLEASALGIVKGACEGTPSTTVVQTDLAEATDDHFIGRVVVFTSGNAAQEATDITDYTGSTGTLTVTALTTAPAAADTFVIV